MFKRQLGSPSRPRRNKWWKLGTVLLFLGNFRAWADSNVDLALASILDIGENSSGTQGNVARTVLAMFANPFAFTKSKGNDGKMIVFHKLMQRGIYGHEIGPHYLLDTVKMLNILIGTWGQDFATENSDKKNDYDNIVASPLARKTLVTYLKSLRNFLFGNTFSSAIMRPLNQQQPIMNQVLADPSVEKVCEIVRILYQNLITIHMLAPDILAEENIKAQTATIATANLVTDGLATFYQAFHNTKNKIESAVATLATLANIETVNLDYSQILDVTEPGVQITQSVSIPAATTTVSGEIKAWVNKDGSQAGLMFSDNFWNMIVFDDAGQGLTLQGGKEIFDRLSILATNLLRQAYFTLFMENSLSSDLIDSKSLQLIASFLTSSPTKAEDLGQALQKLKVTLNPDLEQNISQTLNYLQNPFVRTQAGLATTALPAGISVIAATPVTPAAAGAPNDISGSATLKDDWDLGVIEGKVKQVFQDTCDFVTNIEEPLLINDDVKKFVAELKALCTCDPSIYQKKLLGEKPLGDKTLLEKTLLLQACSKNILKSSSMPHKIAVLANSLLRLKKTSTQKVAKLETPFGIIVDFFHHAPLTIKDLAKMATSQAQAVAIYKKIKKTLHTPDKEIFFSLLCDIHTLVNHTQQLPFNILMICSYAQKRMLDLHDVKNNGGSKFIEMIIADKRINGATSAIKYKNVQEFLEKKFGLKMLISFEEFLKNSRSIAATQTKPANISLQPGTAAPLSPAPASPVTPTGTPAAPSAATYASAVGPLRVIQGRVGRRMVPSYARSRV